MMANTFIVILIFSGGINPNESNDEGIFDLSLEDLLNVEVVSATRSESKISESPVPISVVTDKDIVDSGLDNIPDVLSRLAEIDVMRIGRSQSEVSIRGKGINFNRRLLVLIDGRTEYNDLFGVTLWHALPISVDDIKRIEVVRGPASALFGANAYSGVINIISKKADSDGVNILRAHLGENGTNYANLAVSHKGKAASFKFSYSLQNGDNKETDVPFDGFNRIPTTVNFTPDDSSLEGMERMNLQAIADLSDKWDLRLSAGMSDGILELFQQPGLPRSKWDVKSRNVHLSFNYEKNENNSIQVSAYINKFDYETPLVPSRIEQEALSGPEVNGFFFPVRNSETPFSGKSETLDFSMQYVGKAFDEKLKYVIGGEYREIETTGANSLVETSQRDITSAFSNFTYRLGEDKWILGVGLRADKDSITSTDIGYNLSLQYVFNDTDRLQGTVRRAFRAPSLFELFSSIDLPVPNKNQQVNFRGNAGLEVETIESIDLTYTVQIGGKLQAIVEVFHEKYSELIGNPDSGILADVEITDEGLFISTTSFQNLADADQTGFQANMIWFPSESLKINGSYRFSDPNDLNSVAGETFFSPQHTVKAGMFWRVNNNFTVDTIIQYTGKTDESEFTRGNVTPDGPNFTRANQEAYSTLNLSLRYRIAAIKGFHIYLVGDNLLDEEHVEYYEYDQTLKGVGERIGRTITGGISWNF